MLNIILEFTDFFEVAIVGCYRLSFMSISAVLVIVCNFLSSTESLPCLELILNETDCYFVDVISSKDFDRLNDNFICLLIGLF